MIVKATPTTGAKITKTKAMIMMMAKDSKQMIKVTTADEEEDK